MSIPVLRYDVLDSTSSQAMRLAPQRASEAFAVVAREQSAGRGRQGRAWQSPPGGAWFSIVWPMEGDAQRTAPLPVVCGLGVAREIEALGVGGGVQIKWPNDVLIDERKVAGLLCEQVIGAGAPQAVVIGVGVNVNVDVAALGDDLRVPAISLRAALGRDVDLHSFLDRVIDAIEAQLIRFDRTGLEGELIDAINQRLAWRGRSVTIRRGPRALTGICVSVNERGELVLRIGDDLHAFNAGEIARIEPA